VTQTGVTTTTDYLSGFQYKNTVLQFFPQAEGYVNATQNGTSYTFNYVFNYTDHLGNIRLSYSQDPSTNVLKVIEENHYYPFGLKHTGYNSDQMMYVKEEYILKIKPKPPLFKTSYSYKYNGKEYQDELGLNMYDYGARNYDPALGRWMNVDLLAETSRRWSPYTYAYNNPMFFVDPDGMEAVGVIDPPKYQLNSIDYNKKTGNYTVNESVSVSNSTSKTVENPFGGSTQVTTSTNTTANFTTVINSKGEIVSKSNVVNETVTTSEKDANNVLDFGRVTNTKKSSSTDNSMTGPVASTISGHVNGMNETVIPLKNDQQNFKEMTPDMPGAADGPTGGLGRLGEAVVNQVRGTQTQYSDAITKSHRTGGLQSRDFTTGYATFKTTLNSVVKKLNN
jgi:RHS repeat-associated protein